MKRINADMDNPCTCKVCSKKFPYDGLYSPMLHEEKWREVVEYYNFSEYERKAGENERKLRAGTNVFNYPEAHLFICLGCMEEALGRKITKDDVYSCPFNDKLFSKEK